MTKNESEIPEQGDRSQSHAKTGLALTSLAAIGVVYGDIGTSPLYAYREAMVASGAHGGGVDPEHVLGVLSVITWALIIVVTIKYVIILMMADNDGEGGTFSLLALVQRAMGRPTPIVLALGMLGAGLFYGDAAVTPAVSVLGAIEGLKLVTPAFEPFIVPLAVVIIVFLFVFQSKGTSAVAKFFGPVMMVWFAALAVGGVMNLIQAPVVFEALNPIRAAELVTSNGPLGLAILGAAFLAVTGAEALYADLGHFGRRPIQVSWLFVVMPALLLNYYGQGALLMTNPGAIENPFFRLYPDWALLPMIVLAAAATVIASQAVISGAYSLTQQGVQLKLIPRLRIRQTSDTQQGQIYMPEVNFWLMLGVLMLIVVFGSSSALAAAYGISVTGEMCITSILVMVVARKLWKMPLVLAIGMMVPFLALDLVFFGANSMKIFSGGYVSLAIAGGMILLMWTWRRGAAIILKLERENDVPLDMIFRQMDSKSISTVPGTAIYLTGTPDMVPAAMLHSLKHFKALHEHIVILTIVTEDVPRVAPQDRVNMEELNERFRRVELRFGYAEEPDVPKALLQCRKLGWKFDIMATSFILSQRSLKLSGQRRMPAWQSLFFFYLARNATRSSDYFRIPASRVVELGTLVNV
ncbi:potassium transporter Kup [Rhodobacter capsulatus]|uniref:Probable potassium transport system protein Kup n=1 Tax=Rhodobacter capsulatus TaxID=1061 RepID=A0A4V6WQW7_RHOCA|nr:potassium transporter Kup [Rhodobacter capsulatus]TKD17811.1 potassium transporter Kup [Rhodobacter capsulatus]